MSKDWVNHPEHYNDHPNIECIDVAEVFNFNMGNAIKYIWRARFKGAPLEDLKKAKWYLDREIGNLEGTTKLKFQRALDNESNNSETT